MPFDVTMPDGTVIEGVPDGTTKAQIAAKYAAHTAAPKTQSQPRGVGSDIGAYVGGIARGVRDFDPAALAVNLGTRATDGIGLTDGANAAYRRVMSAGDAKGDKYASGGRVVGQIAGSIPAAAAMGPMAGGAFNGAVTSEAKTTGGFLGDTGLGALLGKGGDLAVKGGAKLISPQIAEPVKRLLARGIPLTPGQIAGGFGKRVEDAMSSTFGLGHMVDGARKRAMTAWNRAAFDDALEPMGLALPHDVPVGHKAIAFMKDTFKKGYDGVLSRMSVNADAPLVSGLATLRNDAAQIPGDMSKAFNGFVDKHVTPYFKNGVLPGQELKNIERTIRKEAKRYGSSTTGAEQAYAELLDQLRGHLRDAAKRTSGPELSKALDAVDSAYANYVPLRDAASKTADGTFLPAGLDTSVRVADRTAGKGAKAAGTARMQGISSDGRAVLPSSMGNSGTPERLAATALLGGGASALGMLSPAAVGSAGMLSLAYTKAGQKAAQAMLTRGQGREGVGAARGLLRASPYAGVGVPPLLASNR